MEEPKFIIQPLNVEVRWDEDGNIISDGIVGRIGADNSFLTYSPKWPDKETRKLKDLEIGQCIRGVEYRQSGSHGIYDIYRVS